MAKPGFSRNVTAVIVVVLMVAAGLVVWVTRRDSSSSPNGSGTDASAGYREPVTLASTGGVLEVTLTAHQGTAALDTVAAPVTDALVFGYEVIRGTPSNGSMSGDNLYPGPTLKVDPGETLIVHMANDLDDLTIQDFYDPAFIPANQPVPKYPAQLTSTPFNLHTHGLHVSPSGNSDNVLLDIPPGSTNTYSYAVPKDMPQGLYWYHSHRHTLTAAQTYAGLAGLLSIGRADGNIPLVTQNNIPIRTMALQYNYVFDRKGGLGQLGNVNWPQYVSTLDPPPTTQLADGSYVPRLTPVNFSKAATGTQFFTNWWAGPLSVNNNRGQFQFIPSNLQSFSSTAGQPTGTVIVAPTAPNPPATGATTPPPASVDIPADPSLPDNQRDVQFTINGQFQPPMTAKPGQTEVWVLANISDFAYMNVTLTETATGRHPQIAVVAQDGNPYPQVHHPTTDGGTTLLIPPSSRYAIAVTMPSSGDLVLEMPQQSGTQSPMANEGVLYTNNGTANPPAVLGTVTVPPSSVSYVDGFFAFPTQVLARVKPAKGQGATTAFTDGQALNAFTSFVDTSSMTADVSRTLQINGGFNNEKASDQDPKAFVYQFDNNAFPYSPLIQPRLGSVEQWTVVNNNNDEHPMHIHVNDFQVTQVVDPTGAGTSGVQMWGQDNANVPAPSYDAAGNVVTPGSLTLRTKFQEFTGTYVIHCHRLNHEDNGLMAIVNVIPAVSSYAIAVPGAPGTAATVRVLDGTGDTPLATVTPFPGFEGTPSVTMADVNGDQVLDLVTGRGPGGPPEVAAYSGAAVAGGAPFQQELARFAAFAPEFRGGVDVAGADIDGNAMADNIIVGSGPGIDAEVKVFSSSLPALGTAPAIFSSFTPYDATRTGVQVATGMVDAMSGRTSIVTAPGPGSPAEIKTFRFDLFTPNTPRPASRSTLTTTPAQSGRAAPTPITTSQFLAFDNAYLGGVSLATGWVAGGAGGAQSIVVGQLAAPGAVKTFSSGSALDGQPAMYLTSPTDHSMKLTFTETASFTPFTAAPGGVRVATTSTVYGADVLVAGPGAQEATGEVRRYQLQQPSATATTLTATLAATVATTSGIVPGLGGD